MGFVYKITNQVNGKEYVGKTNFSLEKRWSEHQRDVWKERNNHRALYRAIRKYGITNFIIQPLFESESPQELEEMEIKLIKEYNTFGEGYNMTAGGDGKTYVMTSEEDRIELEKLYRSGLTIREISKQVGHDVETINARLKEIGFIIPRGGVQPPMRQELHLVKEDEEYYFFSGVHFIEYIIDNELSKGTRDSINSGVNRLLNGSRQSYLGFKFISTQG